MQFEEPITFYPPLLSKIWDLLNEKEREWLLSCMDLEQRVDEAEKRAAEAEKQVVEAEKQAEQRVNTLTEELENLKKKTAKQSSRLWISLIKAVFAYSHYNQIPFPNLKALELEPKSPAPPAKTLPIFTLPVSCPKKVL